MVCTSMNIGMGVLPLCDGGPTTGLPSNRTSMACDEPCEAGDHPKASRTSTAGDHNGIGALAGVIPPGGGVNLSEARSITSPACL